MVPTSNEQYGNSFSQKSENNLTWWNIQIAELRKKLIKLSWSGWRSCQVIESFLFVISPGYYILINVFLNVKELNIFMTLVRKLCAISSFMMCRQLCLVHQLGVTTQSSAEFNNAEILKETFFKSTYEKISKIKWKCIVPCYKISHLWS